MEITSPFSWEKFHQAPIIGIIRGMEPEVLLSIGKAFESAGLSTLEITLNSEKAAEMITLLRKSLPGLNVGAGTVCTMDDLSKALEAGAQFIVCPIVDLEVIKYCVAVGVPIFPGAFTPTEIYQAWSAGASAVKVFPATQLGSTYIKDVLAPLNGIKLIPTGGVDVSSIISFLEAGASGVGMGSSLIDKNLIQDRDFEGLERHFRKIKELVSDYLQK
jgi:2-dehydro-3-deoxyphosphogluconate aldolase/(4S)-4-hydroxy-2-oxoglutarate aldolase